METVFTPESKAEYATLYIVLNLKLVVYTFNLKIMIYLFIREQ